MNSAGLSRALALAFVCCSALSQNYPYARDAGHLAVAASANTVAPKVHMVPAPANRFLAQSPSNVRRSGTPIFVNNLSGLQGKPASVSPFLPHRFSYNPGGKIQIDSQPRELATEARGAPAVQSPLLRGINSLNSSAQVPLNLSMEIGKALKKKKRSRRRKRRRRRRQRELRRRREVRGLLGFQRNYPFSNKFFGQAFPKFSPEAMYFNPVSHDIGGVPKLEVDAESRR